MLLSLSVISCRPLSADNNLKSMEFPQEKCYNKNGVVQKTPARCVEKRNGASMQGCFCADLRMRTESGCN